jgi:hypothetical protein
MEKKSSKDKFLPDIEVYFESRDFGVPITTRGLKHIRFEIMNKTGLDEYQSEVILRLFFEEIRRAVLRGETVYLKNFGRFWVSDKRGLILFHPSPNFRKQLNHG